MLISTKVFARRAGVRQSMILAHARLGILEGTRTSNGWLIEENQMHRYRQMFPASANEKAVENIADLFTIRFFDGLVVGYLKWDSSKAAVVCNSFRPQPDRTVIALVVGTLWQLYGSDIVARIREAV